MRLTLSYVLPLRQDSAAGLDELAEYLEGLADHVEVIVADGSPPASWKRHDAVFGRAVRHLSVDPGLHFLNGKVSGLTTGVEAASHDRVVVADDDVRYGLGGLDRIWRLLEGADLVIPQNYFAPQPWHAVWDTGRSLLNRAMSGDYPGTLGIRRSAFLELGGYDGDVLFENLELIRTMQAGGRSVLRCPDLLVERRPPTARRFWSQRIRQAYDDLAVPARMSLFLGLLPGLLWARRRWGTRSLAAGGCVCVALAEIGRRRAGGANVFPFHASLLAPVWLVERSVCSWLALGSRLVLGGCRYRGTVIRTAAHSRRHLRRRLAGRRDGRWGCRPQKLVAAVAPRLPL